MLLGVGEPSKTPREKAFFDEVAAIVESFKKLIEKHQKAGKVDIVGKEATGYGASPARDGKSHPCTVLAITLAIGAKGDKEAGFFAKGRHQVLQRLMDNTMRP